MTDLVALVAALASIPRLPGAACRGRWELFDPCHGDDPERPAAEAAALALCRRLPSVGRLQGLVRQFCRQPASPKG
jgi:hypothetical protein